MDKSHGPTDIPLCQVFSGLDPWWTLNYNSVDIYSHLQKKFAQIELAVQSTSSRKGISEDNY
jgi:hypothetical protein